MDKKKNEKLEKEREKDKRKIIEKRKKKGKRKNEASTISRTRILLSRS